VKRRLIAVAFVLAVVPVAYSQSAPEWQRRIDQFSRPLRLEWNKWSATVREKTVLAQELWRIREQVSALALWEFLGLPIPEPVARALGYSPAPTERSSP
jgi:hypothetical protein